LDRHPKQKKSEIRIVDENEDKKAPEFASKDKKEEQE